MTPPQVQCRQDVSGSDGIPAVTDVGEPGVQGAGVSGIQGIGVKAPDAAAVAAAVAGNVGDRQGPNGGMFTSGLLSMMLPASKLPERIIFGVAIKLDGAVPIEQRIMAVVTACLAKNRVLPSTINAGNDSPFPCEGVVSRLRQFGCRGRAETLLCA